MKFGNFWVDVQLGSVYNVKRNKVLGSEPDFGKQCERYVTIISKAYRHVMQIQQGCIS